jgi:endonuclease/exonuclease/phosphatase family metal-dependent hydrolase
MKKLFIAISFIVSISVHSQELNVMTFNIRYNTKNDSLNAWQYRKDNAASQIKFHKVHVLGVQEDIGGNHPVMILGDFNSKPSDDPIKILIDRNDPDKSIDTKAISITLHLRAAGNI